MNIEKTYQFPWETEPLTRVVSRKLKKLMGHSTYFRIGTSIMEVPQDMAWTFFDNGDYYEKNVTYWLEKIILKTETKVFYDIGANYGYIVSNLPVMLTISTHLSR